VQLPIVLDLVDDTVLQVPSVYTESVIVDPAVKVVALDSIRLHRITVQCSAVQ
jgi:hypothetical protein